MFNLPGVRVTLPGSECWFAVVSRNTSIIQRNKVTLCGSTFPTGALGAHLNCQLGYTWNQLAPKMLGTPVRVFLVRLLEGVRQTQPRRRQCLLVAARIKECSRWKMLLCLLAFRLAGKPTDPVAVVVALWYENQLRWHSNLDQQLFRELLESTNPQALLSF